MEDTAEIKRRLKALEAEHDWLRISRFLHREWTRRKDSAELTVLLIQQMMTYVLDIEQGTVEELHLHENNLKRKRDEFERYLHEAVGYGLENHTGNKYFLWQMCLYCAFPETWDPILDDPNVGDAGQRCRELLDRARELYPGSVLFQCLEGWISGAWDIAGRLSGEEKAALREEIALFDLRDNMADEIAKGYFPDIPEVFGKRAAGGGK